MQWDFERVILAHGDLIETNAKAVLRKAWEVLLQANYCAVVAPQPGAR